MCGHDLRVQPRRARRISWVDVILVFAVIGVLVIWWQLGSRSDTPEPEAEAGFAIAADEVPVLAPTATPTLTPQPTETPTPVAPEEVFVTHTVLPGETLLSIAGDYGVTVDDIRQSNSLDGDFLNVNQELIIPLLRTPDDELSLPPISSDFTYTVKEGDTIISIGTLFGSSVDDILAANALDADAIIRPGDLLVIPVRAVPPEVIESTESVAPVNSPASTPAGGEAIYIEPRLTGPPNRATLSQDESILLRWVSVDVLEPNEWYVLLLFPDDPSVETPPSIWTKSTSYRLDPDDAPEDGSTVSYSWQVSVVRVFPNAAGGYRLEAASPPSLLRSFSWE